MAAHADARPVEVRVRLRVGGLKCLADVDIVPRAVERELVGQCDVHVAVGGLCQLGELGGLRTLDGPHFGVEGRPVELNRGFGAVGIYAAHDLGVLAEVFESAARVQALRAERELEIAAGVHP